MSQAADQITKTKQPEFLLGAASKFAFSTVLQNANGAQRSPLILLVLLFIMTKYIVVSGGVISGIGKGVIGAISCLS